jgi:hypothetical protein
LMEWVNEHTKPLVGCSWQVIYIFDVLLMFASKIAPPD